MNFVKKHGVISALILLIIIILLFILGESSFKDTVTTTLETLPPQTQTAAVSDFNSNLVAHYTFDEGSGTSAGDSKGSNTGNLVNNPTWVTGNNAKVGNGALQFGGSAAVSAPTDSIGTGEGTISAWIKPSAIPSIGIIASNNSNGFLLYITSWNNRLACSNDGGNHAAYSTNNSIAANSWRLVTAVRTSDGLCTLYIDGVQSGSANQNAGTIIPGSGGLYIGRRPAAAYPFEGVIDDVRIYNKALAASQIQDLYTSVVQTVEPPSDNTPDPTPETPVTPPSPPAQPPSEPVVIEPKITQLISCAQSDVQAAIQGARDGDTIFLPEGNCAWDGLVLDDKRISIIGAGVDKTFVQTKKSIYIRTTKPFRLSGFTVTGDFGGISINKKPNYKIPLKGWRVDHIKFVVPNGYQGNGAVFINGPFNYGVIDHVTIDATAQKSVYVATHVYAFMPDGNETVNGDVEWLAPLSLGTDNAVYIEDSTFIIEGENIGFLNDINYAGRMVIRHNTIKNGIIQTHAGGHGGRGGTSYEIYENTFTSTKSVYRPAHLRSGTGVVFNNTVSGYNTNNFTIDNVRTSTTNGKWGLCDGTQSVDGNTPGEKGWPCMGQIGRASGGTLGHEPSEPLYAWNNNGGAAKLLLIDPWNTAVKQSDHVKTIGDSKPHTGGVVDYVNNGTTPKPGYVPYVYPHPVTQLEDPSSSYPHSTPVTPTVPSTPTVPPLPVVPSTTSLPGDFDLNGKVNSLDFSALSSKWNQSSPTHDLNKDGTVNSLDFSLMAQNWTG